MRIIMQIVDRVVHLGPRIRDEHRVTFLFPLPAAEIRRSGRKETPTGFSEAGCIGKILMYRKGYELRITMIIVQVHWNRWIVAKRDRIAQREILGTLDGIIRVLRQCYAS